MTPDINNLPPSEYFTFAMALCGYHIFYRGNEISKADAFHLSTNEDMRRSIAEMTNPNFEFREKKDYKNGNYVGDRNTSLSETE